MKKGKIQDLSHDILASEIFWDFSRVAPAMDIFEMNIFNFNTEL